MELVTVLLASLLSIIIMFIISRLIGYREISQCSLYDYINSITLGSIAAQLATSTDNITILHNVIAMAVYGAFTFCVAIASNKSKKFRGFFAGHPVILMKNGKLYKNNFKKTRLDLDEFQCLCREQGYFDISKIETAIMEPTGKLSILPKSSDRPLTPCDMNLSPSQEYLCANIIMDGVILHENLKLSGKDMNWLEKQLHSMNIGNIKDIFLATCDSNGKMSVFLKKEAQGNSIL